MRQEPDATEAPIRDYRISVRVRNNRLLRAIEATGAPSVAAWCRMHGICPVDANALICMREPARTKGGEWSARAQRVANALRLLPDDLFPEPTQHGVPAAVVVHREVDAEEMQLLLSAPPTPERLLLANEAAATMEQMLAALPPRERVVIEARYGMGDRDENEILDEVALRVGVTRERVRQIELRAIRRMQEFARRNSISGRALLDALAGE